MIKNITILVVLLGAVYGRQINLKLDSSSIDPYILEDVINSTIEGLRDVLPDPLNIDELDISLPDEEDSLISGTAKISNFEFTGLQSFQMAALNLAVIGVRLNFTFVLPSININTDYNGDLTVLHLVPLYGDGKANIHINDLEIKGSAQADLSDGVSIKGLRLEIFIGNATFDIHGALNNEDFSGILSSILNDLVTSLIDNHQEAITDILSPVLENLINSILASADTSTDPTTDPSVL